MCLWRAAGGRDEGEICESLSLSSLERGGRERKMQKLLLPGRERNSTVELIELKLCYFLFICHVHDVLIIFCR
jgi:hypothetical protein